MHELILVEPRTGHAMIANYDQHTSELTDDKGFPLLSVDVYAHNLNGVFPEWSAVKSYFPTSPKMPEVKYPTPRRLKIQLGLGCNMSCPYCLQKMEVPKAVKAAPKDAVELVEKLKLYLSSKEELKKIEFWGGEPLLYWEKIKYLVPVLSEMFPNTRFSMVTNGTLLTTEIVDFLKEWDFGIAVSHDGPGQHIRGDDPFDDFDQCEGIQYAFEQLHPKFSFNAVFTPTNCNASEIIDWFGERFPGAAVNFEGVVHNYDLGDTNSSFTPEQLMAFHEQLYAQILDGSAIRSPSIRNQVKMMVDSIIQRKPSRILGQGCQMDRPDELAVDLKGNVMTCQNTGAKGEHKLGTLDDLQSVRLNTSYHWSQRKECKECPVLQICAGACMYQVGDNFVNSCNAEFYFRGAFLRVAILLLTGRVLVGYTKPLLRPKLSTELANESV